MEPTRFRLVLRRSVVDAMIAQARAELPNECCGLLAGRSADGVGYVECRYPLANAAASPREYLSDPRSMLDAMKDIDRRSLDVLAVYHSHPTSAPIPSRKDLELNYSPEVINIIIGLAGKAPEMRGWWLPAAYPV